MITFTTGLISFNRATFSADDLKFIKFCTCIKQFLNVFRSNPKKEVELEVWVDQAVLTSLKENLLCEEFFSNSQIVFRDISSFFKKNHLKYEDYWYDSLRFILLGFLCDNKYRVWIDSDTILLSNFDLEEILKKPAGIILPIPSNFPYNFNSQKELETLRQYLEKEGIFFNLEEFKDSHVNTGDILGGDPVLCRILCRKVLQLVKFIKGTRTEGVDLPHPECWSILEYVSCNYINQLCIQLHLPVTYVGTVHHWTGANWLPPCLYGQNQNLMHLDREKLVKALCMSILKENLDIENCEDVFNIVNSLERKDKLKLV